MKLEFISTIGRGVSADVWQARDLEIGRVVAVKIIRPQDPLGMQTLGHARALAAVNHPNIVRVFAVEEIDDPEQSGRRVSGIVMELVEGETLAARLARAPIEATEARAIGLALLDALGHMEERGIAHGDLHEANVLVAGAEAKIIDILYLSEAGQLSSARRESRARHDLLSIRLLLQGLLQSGQGGIPKARKFNEALAVEASLPDIRQAFLGAFAGGPSLDAAAAVAVAMQHVLDPAFVPTPEYADALIAEIPTEIFAEVLNAVLASGACGPEHEHVMTRLWRGLNEGQKVSFIGKVVGALDREVPSGTWRPVLQVLASCGAEGWKMMPARAQLRLERAIVTDILNGYYDVYSEVKARGGALGTWANRFHLHFKDRGLLVRVVAAMLTRNRTCQDYVGQFFLPGIWEFADTEQDRQLVVSSIVGAMRAGSPIVKSRVPKMPDDWKALIAEASG